MELTDLIGPDHVIDGVAATDKQQLLKALALRAAKPVGIDVETVLGALNAREQLGSTGVGEGIAVPHAQIPGLNRFFGLFARLERSIDFAAVDGRPVDLVFLLLIPEGADGTHLGLLAAVLRQLRNPEAARSLRAAGDKDALYCALTGTSQRSPSAGP